MTRPTVADAIRQAEQAMNRIETHEEVCAQRYENIAAGQRQQQTALDEFKKTVTASLEESRKDAKGMQRWVIATLVSALGAAIGMIFVLMTRGH